MIKRNQRFLNFINALSDSLITLASYLVSVWFWLDVLKQTTGNIAAIQSLRHGTGLAAGLYALAMMLLLAVFGLYNSSRIRRIRKEILIVFQANVAGILLIGALLYLLRLQEFSRGVLGIFFLLNSALLCTKRVLLHHALSAMRGKGFNRKHVLVAGTGTLARQYTESLAKERYYGFEIGGYFGAGHDGLDGKYVGGFDKLEEALQGTGIDEVIVALEPDETEWIKPVIEICERTGTRVAVIPFYNDVIPAYPSIEIIGDTKLIYLRSNPLDNLGYAFLKRAFDVLVSLLLLLLLSPLMIAAVVGIKLSSPGPILFKQKRVGRNKHLFNMYKFRSMRVNAAENTGWTTDSDPRRTRFGSFMRKFSIDELPQLFNVLRGEMSLIGPRPEIPFYVEKFAKDIPKYMVKHQIRPGMTGWAQVNGYRGDTSIEERIRYDIWYIENWSVGLDIRILFMTFFGAWINREKIR